MEWPTGDQSTWQMIQGEPASEQVPQSAKALVDGELSKCDASTGFVPDIQVLDQLYVHHPKYRSAAYYGTSIGEPDDSQPYGMFLNCFYTGSI